MLERLNEDFPDINFEIKEINGKYSIYAEGEDLKIDWEFDSQDRDEKALKEWTDILYKHITYRVNNFLAKKKYGEKNA